MKTIFHRTCLVLFAVMFTSCLFFSTVGAAENEPVKEQILTAMEKKYSGHSFEAEFKQVSKLAALDITEEASGRASFSHPGKMRWEYFTPERHEIITNGKVLWMYRPQENQVMQGNAASYFKAGAGGAFLSDISLIRKNYTITVKEVTQEYVDIDLTAKKKTPDISLIQIRVSKKSSEIRRVITHNAYEDTTLFEFSDIQFKDLDPGLFEFKVPQGVNIVDLD